MMVNEEKQFYSTQEAAGLLGVSRVAVFKWIKSGKILANKVGRNFVIPKESIEQFLLRGELTDKEKKQIDEAVHLASKQYKETFKLLGSE